MRNSLKRHPVTWLTDLTDLYMYWLKMQGQAINLKIGPWIENYSSLALDGWFVFGQIKCKHFFPRKNETNKQNKKTNIQGKLNPLQIYLRPNWSTIIMVPISPWK